MKEQANAVIIAHGNGLYSIGVGPPTAVEPNEDSVLEAFLERPAMDGTEAVERKAPQAEISEREEQLRRLEAQTAQTANGSHELFKRHQEGLEKAGRRLRNAGVGYAAHLLSLT